MIYATRVAAYSRHVGSFVLHFAHGSLLVAGLVVTVVIGMRVFDQGWSGLPLQKLFGRAEAAVVAEDALMIINFINSGNEAPEGEGSTILADSFFADFARSAEPSSTQSVAPVVTDSSLADLIALISSDSSAAQSKRRRFS